MNTAAASPSPEALWPLSSARGTPEYLQPWPGDAKVADRIASAAALIRCARSDTRVSAHHLNRVIDLLLWDITEGDGKYRVRYRSEGTRTLNLQRGWQSHLQHEHVLPRKLLRSRIVDLHDTASPELENLLRSATACIVTREEHQLLTEGVGWDRYLQAGVQVWDVATDPPALVDLTAVSDSPSPSP